MIHKKTDFRGSWSIFVFKFADDSYYYIFIYTLPKQYFDWCILVIKNRGIPIW